MPESTTLTPSDVSDAPDLIRRIAAELRTRNRFVISSHARPDGDSIGSQLAMGFALRMLGKSVRIVNKDPAPPHYLTFPGVADIEIATAVEGDFDAAVIMECSEVRRTEVTGLDRFFLINIDHHIGNTSYGDINWFDESAAACGEMVFRIVEALGIPLTREIATHVYLAILTDTGSFHHSTISGRTFEICRRAVEAGVDAAAMARSVFDSNSFGKLKLIGAMLDSMQLEADGRLAILYLDDRMLHASGSTVNDTEGLINLPLTAREIQAVVFFKDLGGEQIRVSLRSKGDLNVREIATQYGGGGHVTAAGFSVDRPYESARDRIVERLAQAIAGRGRLLSPARP
jgi:phosphoesterase RecJ-like protein